MSTTQNNNTNPSQEPEPTTHNEGMLGSVKNKVNSTETGSSLIDLGSSASTMAGECISDVKDKVGSIAPGEAVDGFRGRIQSFTNGNNHKGNSEATEKRMSASYPSLPPGWTNVATHGAEDLPSPEEVEHIDNIEKEKITEFLQEKHMSNANLRVGK